MTIKNRGNWRAKDAHNQNITKLLELLVKEKLTYKQIKEKMQVSDPTLSDYLKGLEREGKIEHFENPKDRRSKWYHVLPNCKAEVESEIRKMDFINRIFGTGFGNEIELDPYKLLLASNIYKLNHYDVLEFLQDFIDNLMGVRNNYPKNAKVDMKRLVEEAKNATFKILYDDK